MKKEKITAKVTEFLINLGDMQINKYSTLVAFYEPKVNVKIVENKK